MRPFLNSKPRSLRKDSLVGRFSACVQLCMQRLGDFLLVVASLVVVCLSVRIFRIEDHRMLQLLGRELCAEYMLCGNVLSCV